MANDLIKIPSDFKPKIPEIKKVSLDDLEIKIPVPKSTFKEQERDLYNKVVNNLEEQETKDKELVMKYAQRMYNKNLIRSAVEGKLDTTPNLLNTMRQHYITKE